MSEVDGAVDLLWGGDERRFLLAIEQVIALEDATDSGCQEVLERILSHRWRVQDLQQTLRLGLIGGGTDPKIARRLVDETVVSGKLMASALAAQAVLSAALVGRSERESVGKEAAAGDASEANAFPSPLSSETAPSSGSLPEKRSA